MWVFDATPLIYLAKAERLTSLDRLDDRLVVPQRVHEEVVVTGLAEGHPDARRVERCVDDGIFEVVEVAKTDHFERLRENENLSSADVAVLTYADSHDGVAVMDETYGRDMAATEGIATRGTAFVVLSLVRDGAIDAEAGRETVEAMLEAGWYCAPDTYAKVVGKLESLEGSQ